MKVTTIGHVALRVADMNKSLDFYVNCLGLKNKFEILNAEYADNFMANMENNMTQAEGYDLSEEQMQEVLNDYLKQFNENRDGIMLAYIEIAPNQFLELFPTSEAEPNDRGWRDPNKYGYYHFSLIVDDIHELRERLLAHHVKILQDASMGMENSWQLWAMDPDGNPIEFMQYTKDSWQLTGR